MSDDGWSHALMAASGVPVAAGRRDDGVRALVNEARADGLDRARLAALGGHRAPEVREAIAARPDCPLAIQATLVHDRRASVRVALASSAGLAVAIAGALSHDREPSVLKALARNAGTPTPVLETLAAHRREDVARLARRSLEGAVLGKGTVSVAELEDRAGRQQRAQAPVPGEAPVRARSPRALAPRPQVPPGHGAAGHG
ncbi:hypothetical protein [Demequina gelatinilytica]|uniref:hypothetical protein n=1 Tax=Demequina gelatinilytica TaxID=1638980 RepID=UPI0007815EB0|nr:hypothetical protein [Demequina gelatinilytica]